MLENEVKLSNEIINKSLTRIGVGFTFPSLHWHTIFVWGCGVLLPFTTALTGLILARSMPVVDYGQLAFFFSVLGLSLLLGSMGFTTQARISAAQYAAFKTDKLLLNDLQKLLAVRLLTLGILGVVALLGLLLGQTVMAVGIGCAALVLIEEFFLGLLQGLGKVVVGTALQVLPALLYLTVVVTVKPYQAGVVWIIITVVGSYLTSLVVAGWLACKLLKLNPLRLTLSRADIRHNLVLTGQMYLIALVMAIYTMFGALILGSLGLFSQTSAFALSLTIVSFPASAFTLVHSTLYYPRYCKLLALREFQAATTWFDQFYRLLGGGGLAVTIVVVAFADKLMPLLFTSQYSFASSTLAILAPTVVLIMVGSFAIWSLVALGHFKAALIASTVQLFILIIGGWLTTIGRGSNFLEMFAAVHSLSALVSLGLALYFLKKLAYYSLHLVRFGFVIVGTGGLVGLVRFSFAASTNLGLELLQLGLASVVSLTVALFISFGPTRLGKRQ